VEVTASTPGLSTGVAVAGANTIYVTWYDPSTDSVLLVSGDGQTFTPVATDGTKGGSQPSLAATADGTVFLAWYDGTNQNLMLGGYGDVGGLELAVQSPTPTGPPSPPAPPPSQECEKVKNGEITVVAQGIAFLTTCIEAEAGEPFTIHFDNRDAATQHNLQIFDSTDASGDLLMEGQIIAGPATIDYQVDALDKGEYFFNCVVHPTMMTGKVVAD
jgi:plastocyanin